MTKKNFMTRGEHYLLIEYLKENLAAINGKPDAKIASSAQRKLGFNVTAYNISGIRKDEGIPVTWEASKTRNGSDATNDKRIMAKQIAKLTKALMHLDDSVKPTGEFVAMYEKTTGYPAPDWMIE